MIPILCAALPGPLIWALNALLLRRIDDPQFNDRLWRHRIRVGRLAGWSLVILGFVAWRWAALTLPLFSVSYWIGMYPMQRRVYVEERSLREYVASGARFALGGSLFWIALTFEPLIVATVGLNYWGAVLAGMIFWLFLYRSQMLWGLRAEALVEPRFQAIVEKTEIRPSIWAIGSPKSSFINAFAWPDAKRPSVLMSRAMLRHLDPDEATAIFAHEMAHLEQFKRKRATAWIFFLIIIIGALLPVLLNDNDALFSELIWIVAIGIGTLLRRSRRQQRETECDLRAVELCGDPDALIRALTKTHRLGRIPSRWDRRYAKRATHPSLEQRIVKLSF